MPASSGRSGSALPQIRSIAAANEPSMSALCCGHRRRRSIRSRPLLAAERCAIIEPAVTAPACGGEPGESEIYGALAKLEVASVRELVSDRIRGTGCRSVHSGSTR
jgi:hypothetical protein